ncbi:AraC family transcriptional regulator [Duganella sp. sic0402]|uniref:AraC family transcriptional regulator n=1 Tax=Duganella sp. sic0402 TaxID=2854786 RepID=UPI001C451AD1|nr:AraC family transcriptional regulator [Duganella sp. sic0402]MBV7536289.1 AraC family transcriptional regulator [Duganella sp. sic0402]
MIDPLAEVVTLLQPRAQFSKVVSGTGAWRVRRSHAGQPFYCAVLEGASRLTVSGQPPLQLEQGDFVLIPESHEFAMTSLLPPPDAADDAPPLALGDGAFRLGVADGPAETVLLVGHCAFDSPDAALLLALLPELIHIRGEQRLATLVQLLRDESRSLRPGRELVLSHLLEVLLIEALRSTAVTASPGLLRGLADERLALALRRMHEETARPWTVAQLAKEAALSRSAFFERFSSAVGVAPMAYLLRWRMARAKLLLRQRGSVAAVAEQVGYGSASAFSVAFTRHVGVPPTRFASMA